MPTPCSALADKAAQSRSSVCRERILSIAGAANPYECKQGVLCRACRDARYPGDPNDLRADGCVSVMGYHTDRSQPSAGRYKET